jgi:hypothetical protein
VRWGQSTTTGNSFAQSGMGFTGEKNIDVPLYFDWLCGRLTHFNYPIVGPATATNLQLQLSIPEFNVQQSFSFRLVIDETTNSVASSPCPYPSTTPCSDKITFDLGGLDFTKTFKIGMVDYTLQLTGFKESRSSTSFPIERFISNENRENNAFLFARIVQPVQPVPEPSSAALTSPPPGATTTTLPTILATVTTTGSMIELTSPSSETSLAAAVGGGVGGVALLLIAAAMTLFAVRACRSRRELAVPNTQAPILGNGHYADTAVHFKTGISHEPIYSEVSDGQFAPIRGNGHYADTAVHFKTGISHESIYSDVSDGQF